MFTNDGIPSLNTSWSL